MFWVVLRGNDVLLIGEPLDGDVARPNVDVLHSFAQIERPLVIPHGQILVPVINIHSIATKIKYSYLKKTGSFFPLFFLGDEFSLLTFDFLIGFRGGVFLILTGL